MNCQKVETVVMDLARTQLLEMGIRDEALAHCEACTACAKRFAEQRALTNALHDLATNIRSVGAPQVVENNLVAELRSRALATNALSSGSRRIYWGSAIAATLLIIVAASAAVRLYQKQPALTAGPNSEALIKDVGRSSVQNVTPQPIAKAETAGSGPSRVTRPPHKRLPKPNTSLAAKPTAKTADYASEIATEFLPLGYGNALNLQDGGQIVRVEVPRSTLASFGLPMNTNRVGERVKADVLFGADGSARAIRFVQ